MKEIEILKKAGCSERVIKHCVAVCKKAVEIASKIDGADLELVRIGALLHDIGRSKTHGVEHGVVGGKIARELGFSDKVVRIIERHVGAGIPKEEAIKLGLPPKDYIPETLEEKIVAYADNLTNGTKHISFEEFLRKLKKRLGNNHAAIERAIRLHRELSEKLQTNKRQIQRTKL